MGGLVCFDLLSAHKTLMFPVNALFTLGSPVALLAVQVRNRWSAFAGRGTGYPPCGGSPGRGRYTAARGWLGIGRPARTDGAVVVCQLLQRVWRLRRFCAPVGWMTLPLCVRVRGALLVKPHTARVGMHRRLEPLLSPPLAHVPPVQLVRWPWLSFRGTCRALT